jgi:hypothetical protein
MLTQIKQLLQRVFNPRSTSYQSDLERFIISKHPTSVAEIEHWTKVFDLRQGGGFYGR